MSATLAVELWTLCVLYLYWMLLLAWGPLSSFTTQVKLSISIPPPLPFRDGRAALRTMQLTTTTTTTRRLWPDPRNRRGYPQRPERHCSRARAGDRRHEVWGDQKVRLLHIVPPLDRPFLRNCSSKSLLTLRLLPSLTDTVQGTWPSSKHRRISRTMSQCSGTFLISKRGRWPRWCRSDVLDETGLLRGGGDDYQS